MRLRTRLFLTWAAILLALWAGAFWTIHRVVSQRIERMAHDAFEGTRRSLEGMQNERIDRMQQAGRLVMSIPSLRELIARQPSEINIDKQDSLKERVDSLSETVRVSFITVLNREGRCLAQSAGSPWADSAHWDQYALQTPESVALLRRVFAPSGTNGEALLGLWSYSGRLYQVVAIPLVFQNEEPQGAMVFGEQISDSTAITLGSSHNSQITFFSDGAAVASSLTGSARQNLSQLFRASAWPISRAFIFNLGDHPLHGWIQPLKDPSSGSTVGEMLIQSDLQDAAEEAAIGRSLALIMISGLALAAAASFLISAAITHPVQRLVAGVQRVARGDLNLSLPVKRRDELGELSSSFNDMVSQLRSRRDLERRMEEAQSSSRAKSQFLANMSHEIRTPLNGVIGMTELLMGTPLTDQQRRFAALVKTSAELLTAQINDILDFSKIEAGKLEIESIDFNLHESVEAVVELLCEKASKKKLELACQFHPDIPGQVRGDPDRLRQILVNLINNAIKFTPSGSIIVRAVLQSVSQGDMTVRFSVTDTGIGIPPDRLDRLFKPFSQVDASTTRKYGGTGLGLAIARQLAELMGGTVGVESQANQGSTFWFTVKLATVKPEEAAVPRPELDARGIRVLAVDDSQTTCAVLEEQMASWGLPTTSTGSAADALAALRNAAMTGQPFKVAVIDSEMPGTSGFELARKIKADPELNRTVLVALLPIEASLGDSQLREAGFAGHMTKPVRQSQLFDNIMRAVAREHAGQLRAEPPQADERPAGPQARGRILVAEDNDVNQIVVVEILRKAGHACVVVDNGRSAVEAAMSGRHDLVLMDCQMPEMDGFEATRLIRQHEAAASKPRLPIIALTANAIKGDREQCLEAGMDGYCSKPVDPRQLLAQIDGFLKHLGSAEGARDASASQNAPGETLAMPAIVVDTLVERCVNNLATVEAVLGKFEGQANRDLESIRRSLLASDVVGATRAAHSLKGTAGIMAAGTLAKLAGRIEQFGRQQQLDAMQAELDSLSGEVRRCIEYLPQVRTAAVARLNTPSAGAGT